MMDRTAHLIETNIALLEQGLELLESLTDSTYSQRLPVLFSNRIGAQMRHILEFYECFFDGLTSRRIDYDARRRDASVEEMRSAATHRIKALLERFESDSLVKVDRSIQVRMEDAPARWGNHALVASSTTRELQALTSHTIHHYALIAMALRTLNIEVPQGFGVAPSTLRYQAQVEAA